MNLPNPSIRIAVDPTNPGQFFACCGLLELADRLWPDSNGWFDDGAFCISAGGTLQNLLSAIRTARMEQIDQDDLMTSPLLMPAPFSLRLDWWLDDRSGGSSFKTWAGQQKVVRIAAAMHAVIDPEVSPACLLNTAAVLFDPIEKKKVEPFYFDARRASQAHSVDIGFSPDAQGMTMPVFAATEFLCMIGLQRFRPGSNGDKTFRYVAWHLPLAPSVASAVAIGAVPTPDSTSYTFRLVFRTKYSKGFLSATH